ncbi:MAG: hypothetical protein ACKKL6_00735 [Candidatus Komeilibacteria bacterium]
MKITKEDNKMRDDGFLIVMIWFLLVVVPLFMVENNNNDTHVQEEVPVEVVESGPVVIETVLSAVKVEYEIQYGSFYTGDQTLIFHRGSSEIKAKEGYGIGYGGLPITSYGWPVHSEFVFELGDSEATLFIACAGPIANEPYQPNGLFRAPGAANAILMDIDLKSNEDGSIFVKAKPTPI